MHLECLGPDVAFAGQAIRDAVRSIRAIERDVLGYSLTKANASPVSAADIVVQAFVSGNSLVQREPHWLSRKSYGANAENSAPLSNGRFAQSFERSVEFLEEIALSDRNGCCCAVLQHCSLVKT